MNCKDVFLRGISEECFSCIHSKKCLNEYVEYVIKERESCEAKVIIKHDGEKWEIYHENKLLYTISDNYGEISNEVPEFEHMCAVVEFAQKYVELMQVTCGVYINEYVASAITTKLSLAWCEEYNISTKL